MFSKLIFLQVSKQKKLLCRQSSFQFLSKEIFNRFLSILTTCVCSFTLEHYVYWFLKLLYKQRIFNFYPSYKLFITSNVLTFLFEEFS